MSDSAESEEELHDIDWTQPDPFEYEDPFALSPQITAVLHNDVQGLQRLIESGKSVNIIDNNGNTPLHTAVMKDKRKAFDYLMTVEEVRIDAENFEGTTPLLLAMICTKEYFALELIKKGADVNTVNHMEYAPLHYAAGSSVQVGRSLIERGAEINARNALEETPLYTACERATEPIIHMLLYYGADVGIPSYAGILPFDLVLSRCPLYLQEIFFDYTFDEETIPVNLHTLTMAMTEHSPLFTKIVEKTLKVLYDENDLKFLNESLPLIENCVFSVFLRKFEDVAKDMFSLCSSLMDYVIFLGTRINDKPNFVDFFYILCESPLVSLVIENYQPKLHLVHSIINRNISEETLTKLMCCLLSYGVDIISSDLNSVYKRYEFCELFKIMLHMDIVDYSVFRKDAIYSVFLMPIIIYDIAFDIERCFDKPQKYIASNCLHKLLKFFALPKLKEYCLKAFANDDEIMNKVKRMVKVPSLVELARNVARKHIIQKYNVEKNVHFFTILKWLPISDIYKAILSYEKELYKFE